MTTTITILVDNEAQDGLLVEHGLSLLIEHNNQRILFDTGQNEALFFNAKKLNIPLDNLDIIILSHGHYDHGGNIATLLSMNPNAIFYAHPDCLKIRYSLHHNKPVKTISLSKPNSDAIKQLPNEQCKFITQATEIIPNIWLTGQIPRVSEVEDTGGPFFLDTHAIQKDFIEDDMSLWIESESALTVVCGCCHSGIINTLNYIQQQSGKSKPIKTLLGGLHLVNAKEQRITHTIEYLNKQPIIQIYPGHCSGAEAMQRLNKSFKNQVEIAQAGLTITPV